MYSIRYGKVPYKVPTNTNHSALIGGTFQAVTNGLMKENVAVAVAKHLPDPKLQDQLFAHIAEREADGKSWSDEQVETAAKKMASAGKTTVAGVDLFGEFEDEHSTFDQEVELESHIGRQLSQEANDFGAVASKRRADRVAGAGNTLNLDENARLRDSAVSNAELFDQHRHLKGPVAEAVKASAAKLAQDCRLIARSSSHLQNRVARLDIGGLCHQAHDRGLADRLATGDGQRHVVIGAFGEMTAHEKTPVDHFHRRQHAGIRHPA
jgi:hypothetical protein